MRIRTSPTSTTAIPTVVDRHTITAAVCNELDERRHRALLLGRDPP